MSETKRKVPKLRFPGFTEDWEQRKVSEVFKITRGQVLAANLTSDKKTEINKYPVFSSQTKDNGLMGYYSEFLFENAITWTTDGANAGTVRYRKGKFYSTNVNGVLLNDDGLACTALSEIIDKVAYKYVSHVGNPKLMNNVMANIDIIIPNDKEELIQISKIIETFDKSITLHQRKLENLKLKKKALLQKLFPKNGEQFPELRFPGFTDAWEQRKLGELFDRYESRVETPHDGYWRLGLRSHCKGTFHTYVEPGSELETSDMNIVKEGNFILNITFAWELALAITDSDDDGKLVSHRFPQFKPKRNLLIKFFKHTLSNNKFKHHLQLASPGGAGRNKVLKINEMLKFELLFPNMEEQLAITKILEDFDNLITLHQRKLEHLQLQKKALLQQMFI